MTTWTNELMAHTKYVSPPGAIFMVIHQLDNNHSTQLVQVIKKYFLFNQECKKLC